MTSDKIYNDENDECTICLEKFNYKVINVMIEKCRHSGICHDCIKKCKKCPFCRGSINKYTRLNYNSLTNKSIPNYFKTLYEFIYLMTSSLVALVFKSQDFIFENCYTNEYQITRNPGQDFWNIGNERRDPGPNMWNIGNERRDRYVWNYNQRSNDHLRYYGF